MGLFDRFKKKAEASAADAELEALLRQLEAPDWKTRFDAATRLGQWGARAAGAVPALEAAISDDNGEVCLAASDALSKIRRALHA